MNRPRWVHGGHHNDKVITIDSSLCHTLLLVLVVVVVPLERELLMMMGSTTMTMMERDVKTRLPNSPVARSTPE